MGCVLNAISYAESFKPIIAISGLETYRVFDKGEKRNQRHIANNYGFSCDVSTAEWTDLNQQFKDSIHFLKKNMNKLKKIKNEIKSIEWTLDFPFEGQLSKDIAVQCNNISIELIKLCAELEIGIELSNYNLHKIGLKEWIMYKLKRIRRAT